MGKLKSGKREAVAVPLGPLAKGVLKVAYRARRPVLLEGETGIGKSEVVAQVARELGVGFVVLDLSLLEPPDLVGLPVIVDGRTTYAPPAVLPRDGAGLLMLEELNRAERYIQQPALQLLTARRLHEYELPAGWSTVAAINPEDGEYQVTPLDPALRARFLNLAVRADRAAWLGWAAENAIHPTVLQLARQQERFFDGIAPRTWAYVSDLLKALRPAELHEPALLHAALCGYVGPAWAQLLEEALSALEEVGGLDLARLLAAYHRMPDAQQHLAELKRQGQTDALDRIAYHALEVVDGPALAQAIGNKSFSLDAFERLIVDLPGDARESLQKALGGNLLAAPLLEVRPADLLRGYPGSTAAQLVAKWAREPGRQHRVQLLVGALCQHLDKHPDPIGLRKDRGALTGLGLFLSQVSPRWSGPLDEVLHKRNVQAIHP